MLIIVYTANIPKKIILEKIIRRFIKRYQENQKVFSLLAVQAIY